MTVAGVSYIVDMRNVNKIFDAYRPGSFPVPSSCFEKVESIPSMLRHLKGESVQEIYLEPL